MFLVTSKYDTELHGVRMFQTIWRILRPQRFRKVFDVGKISDIFEDTIIRASITAFTLSSSNHLFIHTISNNTAAALLTLCLPGQCRASTKRASGVERERGRDREGGRSGFNESSGICIRFILSVLHHRLCPKPNPQHALPATLITSPFWVEGRPAALTDRCSDPD